MERRVMGNYHARCEPGENGENCKTSLDCYLSELKAETLLYTALIGYIHYEAPDEERNMNTLVELINAMEVREDDDQFKNTVDFMFDALEERDPLHFAVRQYKKYKLAAGVISSKGHITIVFGDNTTMSNTAGGQEVRRIA